MTENCSVRILLRVIEDELETILVLGELLMPFEGLQFRFRVTLFYKEDLTMIQTSRIIYGLGFSPIHVIKF